MKFLGMLIELIKKGESCEEFCVLMNELNELVLESEVVIKVEEVLVFVKKIGFFVIVCFVYMLGGMGGGIVYFMEEFEKFLVLGLCESVII